MCRFQVPLHTLTKSNAKLWEQGYIVVRPCKIDLLFRLLRLSPATSGVIIAFKIMTCPH